MRKEESADGKEEEGEEPAGEFQQTDICRCYEERIFDNTSFARAAESARRIYYRNTSRVNDCNRSFIVDANLRVLYGNR